MQDANGNTVALIYFNLNEFPRAAEYCTKPGGFPRLIGASKAFRKRSPASGAGLGKAMGLVSITTAKGDMETQQSRGTDHCGIRIEKSSRKDKKLKVSSTGGTEKEGWKKERNSHKNDKALESAASFSAV